MDEVTPLLAVANWSTDQVLAEFHTSLHGLTEIEAKKRLTKYGPNHLAKEKDQHIIIQFLLNFKNPLILILLLIALFSFILGSYVQAIVVAVMVLVSVIFNFWQEYHATQAAAKLQAKVATKSEVWRNGIKQEIKTTHLTIGDVVELNAGDLVPADCRLIQAKDLFINQSALTGESFPVEKNALNSDQNQPHQNLTDHTNLVFLGSSVVSGAGLAVIVHIAPQTEFGKISQTLDQTIVDNEFTRGIHGFSILILKTVTILVGVIFILSIFVRHHDFLESLAFAVAVAVGLTPEFLPMIMTVTMSRGSIKMAKKGAIVKKINAIPTFGSMDVLCTDKTGTLTENNISLIKYTNLAGETDEGVLKWAYLVSAHQTGISSPLDQAVLNFKKIDIADFTKVDEIPFDFSRKRMSVVVKQEHDNFLITKGAPEEMLAVSTHYEDHGQLKKIDANTIKKFQQHYQDLSQQGFRTVAIGYKKLTTHQEIYHQADEKDLILYGLTSFLDPAKKTAPEAIQELEKMGIEIKVLTGDNELVTLKICQDVGVVVKGVLLGSEVTNLTDAELQLQVENKTVFARVTPVDKNRVIQALMANRHVVGFMGDGINDAPSMKTADVGISVSNAVDVAKESADIILTNKSLHELIDGVVEGRHTFGNTMKYILMGLSSNFGNMFSVLGAVLFVPFLPMLPVQILLNNFLYDFSQLSIPTDSVDKQYIQQPKRWDNKFIARYMLLFGPISSIFDLTSYYLLYAVLHLSESAFQTGWFMESLATQVFVVYIIRTRLWPFIQSRPSFYVALTTIVAVAVGWLIPLTSLGTWFGFSALPINVVMIIGGIVLVYLITAEISKRLFYSLGWAEFSPTQKR